jgi:hypothetical protein
MNLPKASVAAIWKQSNDSTYLVTLKSKALAREVCFSVS